MTNHQVAKYHRIAQKFGINSPQAKSIEAEFGNDPVFVRRVKDLKKLFRSKKGDRK